MAKSGALHFVKISFNSQSSHSTDISVNVRKLNFLPLPSANATAFLPHAEVKTCSKTKPGGRGAGGHYLCLQPHLPSPGPQTLWVIRLQTTCWARWLYRGLPLGGHVFLSHDQPASFLTFCSPRPPLLILSSHPNLLFFTSPWSLVCLIQIFCQFWVSAGTSRLTFPFFASSSSASCPVSIPHPHLSLADKSHCNRNLCLERDVQWPL